MAKDFFGIVLYDIQPDNCLNGIWTNVNNKGEIRNEIARRVSTDPANPNDKIAGSYECSYIEIDNKTYTGTLTITGNIALYNFNWDIRTGIKFEGKGFLMNDKQIAVSYWPNPS